MKTPSITRTVRSLLIACGVLSSTSALSAGVLPDPDPEQAPAFTIWGVDTEENEIAPPDFPAPSAVVFDSRNAPWILCTEPADEHFYTLSTLREGAWKHFDLAEIIRTKRPDLRTDVGKHQFELGWMSIDDQDRVYAVVPVWTRPVHRSRSDLVQEYALVATADGGKTFSCILLSPGVQPPKGMQIGPGPTMPEADNGARRLARPPAIADWEFVRPSPFKGFSAVQRLSVYLPEWEAGALRLGEPIKISDRAMGVVTHSGSECLASAGGTVFLAYLAFPDEDPLPNRTILRIAEIDRRTRTVLRDIVAEDPVKDNGRIIADVHPAPAVATDSQGVLHIISGSHNEPFRYFRSLSPGTLADGLSEPVRMAGGQTYPSLNITPNDRLNLAYRHHPALYVTTRPPDATQWTPPVKVLGAPAFYRKYTAFYHKLAKDRKGALFLAATFFEFKEGWTHGYYPRTLLLSTDGGHTWKQATTDRLLERMRTE